jgi:hypothetical protein
MRNSGKLIIEIIEPAEIMSQTPAPARNPRRQRGAAQVAAGLWPAVEPGVPPGASVLEGPDASLLSKGIGRMERAFRVARRQPCVGRDAQRHDASEVSVAVRTLLASLS